METRTMAKITITESVHVSVQLDGETIELDLAAGDADVEQAVADLLIAQSLAVLPTKGSKKTASTEPVVEDTIADQTTEA